MPDHGLSAQVTSGELARHSLLGAGPGLKSAPGKKQKQLLHYPPVTQELLFGDVSGISRIGGRAGQ